MATNDPMQSAIEATEYSNDFYGKVEVSAKFVYSAKGEKPRDFVDGDDIKRRSTEVALSLTTIDAQGLTRPVIERRHLNWTPVWKNIVWESIKSLGFIDLYALNGAYVKATMVPTGRVYTSKTTGKEVAESTMKFVAAYASEADCIKAYEAESGNVTSQDDAETVAEWEPVISALVTTSKGDLAVLASKLQAVKSPFDVESAVVHRIIASQAVAA